MSEEEKDPNPAFTPGQKAQAEKFKIDLSKYKKQSPNEKKAAEQMKAGR